MMKTPESDFELRAEDVMVSPVITISSKDTMQHAASIFLDKNISGAPVLNGGSFPVGVLTKTDITHYERDHVACASSGEDRSALRTLGALEAIAQGVGFHAEDEEESVSEWMTPKLFSVSKETSLRKVVKEMLEKRIHRVFVTEKNAVVGVITAFDLIRVLDKKLESESRELKTGINNTNKRRKNQ